MTLVYNKEYYLKNKERILEYQRQDRLKHKEKRLQHRREYKGKPEIRERLKQQRRKWRIKNKKRYLEQKKKDDKKYRLSHMDKIKAYNRSDLRKKRNKEFERKPERITYKKEWKRNNPRSNRKYGLELYQSMNNVRLRDKNTCQWYGCGLSFKQAPIHVHHIFPRSEYPELELVENYMICYCANHHGLFHRYRGDAYSELISPKYQELIMSGGD